MNYDDNDINKIKYGSSGESVDLQKHLFTLFS